jgi:hypothetical protein
MISTCPNCALASVDEWRVEELNILDNAKKLAITTRGIWQLAASWMDSLDQRFRYVLAFLIGAAITAAALVLRLGTLECMGPFLFGDNVAVEYLDDAVEVGDQFANLQCVPRGGCALKNDADVSFVCSE